MSLVFSNTTTKNGIIQRIERTCGFNDGDISGNATLLAQFTGDVNTALDEVYSTIFSVGGTWQFDDSNHTDYPIITTDIFANQRDYSFTADENGNLILDIYKIMVADSSGNFSQMYPSDVSTGRSATNYWDGLNTTGLPNSYDKLANAIFLDPIPNYSYTDGLKVYINREGSYFSINDTSKKPGFTGLYHEYLVLHPSYSYALRNGMNIAQGLRVALLEIENAIKDNYKSRSKDERKMLVGRQNNAR